MRKLPCLPGALAMRARTAEQRTVYMELSNQRTRSIPYTCFYPFNQQIRFQPITVPLKFLFS